MSLLVPDIGLLFWMTLSFGILLFILVRYAFPRINQAIEGRNRQINLSLEEVRQAREIRSMAEEEARRIREEANREYAGMMTKAGELKEQILADARQEAQAEMAVIREKAYREIEEHRQQVMAQAGKEIVELSAGIAEKALRRTLDSSGRQKELIRQLMEEEIHLKKN